MRTTKIPPDGGAAVLTLALRVSPGSARTSVGGRRGEALVVRVTEAAVDGRATEAALVAVARALGLRRPAVRLVRGATTRDKIVAVHHHGDDAARLAAVVGELMAAGR